MQGIPLEHGWMMCSRDGVACISWTLMMQGRDENMFPRSVRARPQPYYLGIWSHVCESRATQNRENQDNTRVNASYCIH